MMLKNTLSASTTLTALTVLATSLLLLTTPARAVDVDGMQMPDEFMLGPQQLGVNGKGTRLYSWVKIKVYSAVLYTPKPTSDAQALIQAPYPRVLFVKMRVDSKRDDAVEAWKYYLKNNCANPCPVAAARWTPFLDAMANLKEGDAEAYIFTGKGFELRRNDAVVVRIEDAELASLILSGWLGKEPTTPELKKALLGL
jgi:hypothetical protein